VIIDGLRKLGMHVSADEADDYVHLWRWVGRTIGVHVDVLPTSEPEASRLANLIRMTMGEPDSDSRELTRALFDAPYKACVTEQDYREAQRRVVFGRLVCRELIGDELADKLHVPPTTIRYAMPMRRRFVSSLGRFTRAVPYGDRTAIVVGSRYWDRVVEIGLQGATYEFPLPKRLANLGVTKGQGPNPARHGLGGYRDMK